MIIRSAIYSPIYYLFLFFVISKCLTNVLHADQFGDFTYTDHGTYIEITDYPTSATGHVEIPETIVGKPVTSIGTSAFYSCYYLTSVTIPDSVTSIGSFAFYSCYYLTSITIGKSVTSIGDRAFYYCSGLTSVTIPDSVTSIGSYAFYSCSGLTSITIGKSVTSIGYRAFYFCSGLTSVTIPDSVTSIGYGAFSNCSDLTSAYFTGNAPESFSSDVFLATNVGFRAYYLDTSTGFSSPTWNGYPTEMINTTTYPNALWLIAHYIPYNTDMSSDHNGDSVSLLMAYALDLDPNQNLSASMPRPVVSASQLELEFFSGSDGVSYLVEASSDLVNWSTEGIVLSEPDEDQMRTAAIDRTEPSLFMKLVVNQ